jgi:Fur family ferric uptake transcriptional regulator
MKPDRKTEAKCILDDYLKANDCRKTTERYAILSAAYDIGTSFSVADLSDYLLNINMMISTATLYNTLSLFEKLHIVVCHRFAGATLYEASIGKSGAIYQVCTVCGNIKSIPIPAVAQALADAKTKRFKKSFTDVVIYGICSRCQTVMSHRKAKSIMK